MTADQFTAAQQSADVAYEMTLYETGSGEKAADAYKSVMTAFYAADEAQPVYDRAFYDSIIAERMADEASAHPKYEPLSRLIWLTQKPIEY